MSCHVPPCTAGKRYFTWDKAFFPTPQRMQDDLASRGRKVRPPLEGARACAVLAALEAADAPCGHP